MTASGGETTVPGLRLAGKIMTSGHYPKLVAAAFGMTSPTTLSMHRAQQSDGVLGHLLVAQRAVDSAMRPWACCSMAMTWRVLASSGMSWPKSVSIPDSAPCNSTNGGVLEGFPWIS
jgi:hypothetical protein